MLPDSFRLSRYQVSLEPKQSLRQPRFFGATLRGGFGYAFKRLVCIQRDTPCDRCLVKAQCAYAYIFETEPPPGAQKLRNLSDIPRPFVFEPPTGRVWEYGSIGVSEKEHPLLHPHTPIHPYTHTPTPPHRDTAFLTFGLILIGRAIDYLPYFVLTLIELGKAGLGKDRTPFTVQAVHALGAAGEPVEIYNAADQTLRDHHCTLTAADLEARASVLQSEIRDPQSEISAARSPTRPHSHTPIPPHSHTPTPPHTIHFLTPTRLKTAGEALERIEFHHLLRALLRRLSSLCYFHCGCELEVDYRGLIAKAEEVRSDASGLRWVEQSRHSTRQERDVKMSGFVGRLVVEGEISEFLPLLLAGEVVHVGKGTVMGMGKYELAV